MRCCRTSSGSTAVATVGRSPLLSRKLRTGGVYFRKASGTASAGGVMIRCRAAWSRKAASITASAAASSISTRIGGVASTSAMLSKP